MQTERPSPTPLSSLEIKQSRLRSVPAGHPSPNGKQVIVAPSAMFVRALLQGLLFCVGCVSDGIAYIGSTECFQSGLPSPATEDCQTIFDAIMGINTVCESICLLERYLVLLCWLPLASPTKGNQKPLSPPPFAYPITC